MKLFTTVSLLVLAAIACADVDINTVRDFAATFPLTGSIKPLIENGFPVRQGDLPHHVTIYVLKEGSWKFIAGTLISSNCVLTTLSPLLKIQEVRVYHGSNQLPSAKIAFARRVIPHPRFDPRTGINNLAILVLNNPLVINRETQPITLPPLDWKNANLENQNIFVSGFGSKNGQPLQTLTYGQFQVTSHQFCRSKYPNQAGALTFCAVRQRSEYPGYGDLGAPAFIRVSTSNVLVGIFSFGAPEQVSKGEPSAFVNVCPSIEWIHYIIASNKK